MDRNARITLTLIAIAVAFILLIVSGTFGTQKQQVCVYYTDGSSHCEDTP